jgi:hypothetical protein
MESLDFSFSEIMPKQTELIQIESEYELNSL